MDRSEEDRAINEAADRLSAEFPQLPRDRVRKAVEDSRPEFEDKPIREFIPLFVERAAKQRLREMFASDKTAGRARPV